MSELKVYRFLGQDEVWPDANLGSDYYLKSEADKVIAHQKYRRCLAMVRCCNRMFSSTFGKERYWQKWSRRWLELAEKFKEAK
jgi:hypothetical protein